MRRALRLHGGCPKDRFTSTPDGEPGLNYLCPSYKDFHHVDALMQTMSRLLAANRAPAEIIDDYAAGDASRGRKPCTCGSGRKWEHCHGRSLPQATSLAITGRFPPTHA